MKSITLGNRFLAYFRAYFASKQIAHLMTNDCCVTA